jgi:chemotaxis protein CheZ
MQQSVDFKAQYSARVEALRNAFERGDEAAFLAVLDELLHTRKAALLSDLRSLTGTLKFALERFSLEAHLADLAENEIPDARLRLAHVLEMTNEAAHRTLDLVEQSGPPAERTSKTAEELNRSWKLFRARKIAPREFKEMVKRMDRFLPVARSDAEAIRRNLAEVLLTQGYQDLTGQIIRGVMQLVQELESTLAKLVRLAGSESATPRASEAEVPGRAFGPAVPGLTQGKVATGQQDVDDLLSDLGM